MRSQKGSLRKSLSVNPIIVWEWLFGCFEDIFFASIKNTRHEKKYLAAAAEKNGQQQKLQQPQLSLCLKQIKYNSFNVPSKLISLSSYVLYYCIVSAHVVV